MTQHIRRSPEQWLALVQQWQESGLSAPQFCEQAEVTYTRGKAPKQRPEDCVNDSGLRFNDQVPVGN